MGIRWPFKTPIKRLNLRESKNLQELISELHDIEFKSGLSYQITGDKMLEIIGALDAYAAVYGLSEAPSAEATRQVGGTDVVVEGRSYKPQPEPGVVKSEDDQG